MKFTKLVFNSHKNHNPSCDILEGHLTSDKLITYGIFVKDHGKDKKGTEFMEYYKGPNYKVGAEGSNYSRSYSVDQIPKNAKVAWKELKKIYEKEYKGLDESLKAKILRIAEEEINGNIQGTMDFDVEKMDAIDVGTDKDNGEIIYHVVYDGKIEDVDGLFDFEDCRACRELGYEPVDVGKGEYGDEVTVIFAKQDNQMDEGLDEGPTQNAEKELDRTITSELQNLSLTMAKKIKELSDKYSLEIDITRLWNKYNDIARDALVGELNEDKELKEEPFKNLQKFEDTIKNENNISKEDLKRFDKLVDSEIGAWPVTGSFIGSDGTLYLTVAAGSSIKRELKDLVEKEFGVKVKAITKINAGNEHEYEIEFK